MRDFRWGTKVGSELDGRAGAIHATSIRTGDNAAGTTCVGHAGHQHIGSFTHITPWDAKSYAWDEMPVPSRSLTDREMNETEST